VNQLNFTVKMGRAFARCSAKEGGGEKNCFINSESLQEIH
jgi:hypothetical protein